MVRFESYKTKKRTTSVTKSSFRYNCIIIASIFLIAIININFERYDTYIRTYDDYIKVEINNSDRILSKSNANNNNPAPQIIKPTYQCERPFPSNSKIVFVHVFKTAGSTMRKFFIDYAKECSKSAIVIMRCTGGTTKSMRKGRWRPCMVQYGVSREGDKLGKKDYVKGAEYMEETIDIIAGHHRLDSTFALSGNDMRSQRSHE